MLAVAVAVWTFVEIARIFEDVVVLVPTETVVVLVIVFDKVIVFISIVGMQVVGKSIAFNVANFVVLRLLLARSSKGVIPTARFVVVFALIFMKSLGVITHVRAVIEKSTRIQYVEADAGNAGSIMAVCEVFLLVQ